MTKNHYTDLNNIIHNLLVNIKADLKLDEGEGGLENASPGCRQQVVITYMRYVVGI